MPLPPPVTITVWPASSKRGLLAMAQRRSGHAAGEALRDRIDRQVTPDENHPAGALLAVFPRTLMVAIEDHVHALQHEALVGVLERDDALTAQDVRAFLLHEVLHPGKELVRIERLVERDRHRLHVFVVIVLQAAMAVTVRMTVMMVVVAM